MAKNKAPTVAAYDEMDYRAESDVRTLVEADKIRKDKPRLARAKACAKKQLAALTAATAEPAKK